MVVCSPVHEADTAARLNQHVLLRVVQGQGCISLLESDRLLLCGCRADTLLRSEWGQSSGYTNDGIRCDALEVALACFLDTSEAALFYWQLAGPGSEPHKHVAKTRSSRCALNS